MTCFLTGSNNSNKERQCVSCDIKKGTSLSVRMSKHHYTNAYIYMMAKNNPTKITWYNTGKS